MVAGGHGWRRDAALRGIGLALIALGLLAVRQLFRTSAAPGHGPAPLDFVLATTGFLSLSAGAVLSAAGASICDRIEVSERWARRERLDARSMARLPHGLAMPADRVAFEPAERR